MKKAVAALCGLIVLVSLVYSLRLNHINKVMPDVTLLNLTDEESQLVVLSSGYLLNIKRYQINRTLPAGTMVRAWIESYCQGERVEDSLSTTTILTERTEGLRLYAVFHGEEVSLAFRGHEIVRGQLTPFGIQSQLAGSGGVQSIHTVWRMNRRYFTSIMREGRRLAITIREGLI